MTKNVIISALITVVCVFQPFTVEADLHAYELDFHDYYANYGRAVEWRAFQQIFCEYMAPSNVALTSLHVSRKPLQFATLDSHEIPVDMLACEYTDASSISASVWYAQSPRGKFHRMTKTGGGEYFENFSIAEEVELPPASVEKSFHDHYARHEQDTTFTFPPHMINDFCESERSPGFALASMEFVTKNLMLFSQSHEEIPVQMLSCLYEESNSAFAYQGGVGESFMRSQRYPYKTWFVKAPNGDYYEARLFGNGEDNGLAIRRKTRYSN